MDHFGNLRGLQIVSEVRFDLRFEISDHDYLHIHVHIAYTLLMTSEATMASKKPQRSDLTLDLQSVTYISLGILLIWY